MAIDEQSFHHVAEAVIETLHEQLEAQDEEGIMDLESDVGMLTILPEGAPRPWVISRHVAAREIWLSSPVSGGLHFRPVNDGWQVPDGRELFTLLSQELTDACGRPIGLNPAALAPAK